MIRSRLFILSVFILSFVLNPNQVFSQYSWYQLNNFGGNSRYGAVSFVIGDTAYVGLGKDGSGYLSDFWKYDAGKDSWTKIADFGGNARAYAVAFTINNKGYVATGENGATLYKDIWEYDPSVNQWTQKADFGGTARSRAVAFCAGDKGYIATGYDGVEKKDLWEYDPSGNTWQQKASLTSDARQQAIGFGINGKGYVCAGVTYSSGTMFTNDVYEYNPATNTWAEKSFAESHLARTNASSFVLNNKAYICGGLGKKDLWQYNPSTNQWNQLADFGLSGETNRADATGFAVKGRGYIALGDYMESLSTTILKNDVWTYSQPLPPEAPLYFTIQSITSNTAVLSWSLNSTGADFYIIEKSIGDNLHYVKADSLESYYSGITVSGLPDTSVVFFRIKAGSSAGYSPYSNEVKDTTLLGVPSYLLAIPISYKRIDLRWTNSSTHADKYYIERSVGDNLNFLLKDSIDANASAYWGDTSLTEGVRYYYRVYMKYMGNKKYTNENYAIPAEQGSWNSISGFPSNTGDGTFSFMIGNKFYVGYVNFQVTRFFWEYDAENKLWTRKADYPGGGNYNLSAFAINGKGYAGLGRNTESLSATKFNDFWEYDPLTDKWTQKGNFAGTARYLATSIALNNKGYIGFGANTAKLTDIWEYDPSDDSWTQKTDCPVTLSSYPTGFTVNNIAYFIDNTGILYSFDPSGNKWTKMNDFTDWKAESKAITYIEAFNAGSRAYALLSRKNSFWEYDAVNDTWIRRNSFSNTTWPYSANYMSVWNDTKACIHPDFEYANNQGMSTSSCYQYNPLAPSSPSNLEITDYSSSEIHIRWSGNTRHEVKYYIQRAPSSNGTWVVIDSVGVNQTSYVDTHVTANNRYYYRVFAKSSFGNSDLTNVAYAVTGVPIVNNFNSVISKFNEKNVYVDYLNDNSYLVDDGADGYILERSDEADPDNFVLVDSFKSIVKQFVDTGLIPGKWYNYRLKAFNKLGNSAYNGVVKALAGSVSMYSGRLIADQAVLFDDRGYNLEYSYCYNKTLTVVPKSPGKKVTFTIDEIGIYNTDTLYIYNGLGDSCKLKGKYNGTKVPDSLIYADNPDGALTLKFRSNCSRTGINSGWMITAKSYSLLPPSNLKSENNNSSEINLRWNDNSSDEDYFIIERSADDDKHFTKLDSVSSGINTFTDNSCIINHLYYYRIRSKTGNNYSEYSNTLLTELIPYPPTSLGITIEESNNVLLTWEDKSDNEDWFIISWSYKDSLHFADIDTVPYNTESYMVLNISNESKNYFRVRALNVGGSSANTFAIPTVIPYTPVNLNSTSWDGQTIRLSWYDISNVEDGYIIERSESDDTHFVSIDTVAANTENFTDINIIKNVTYYYRVKAYDALGESYYSNYTNYEIVETDVETVVNNNDLYISPNPATEMVYIKGARKNSGAIIQVSIFDELGSQIKEVNMQNNSDNNVCINISGLAAGVYYFRIKSTHGLVTRKVVKL